MVERAGTGVEATANTTITREEYNAISCLISATDARQNQWQAVTDGTVHECIDELYEADAEECQNMVAMYGVALHTVRNLMKRFEANNKGDFI